MVQRGRGAAWTSPSTIVPLIIYVLSTLMAAGSAYLAINRNDTKALQDRITAIEIGMAEIKRDVSWLERRER